jgi:hypothetical protein
MILLRFFFLPLKKIKIKNQNWQFSDSEIWKKGKKWLIIQLIAVYI